MVVVTNVHSKSNSGLLAAKDVHRVTNFWLVDTRRSSQRHFFLITEVTIINDIFDSLESTKPLLSPVHALSYLILMPTLKR